MNKAAFTIFLFFIPLLLVSAQDNYPIGARSNAMANASAALTDIWSVSQNQAGMAFLNNFSVGVNYENKFLLKQLSVKAGTVVFPVKGGTFGLLISNFGYNLYNENKYALSFAKSFGEKFSAGISMDYLTIKIGENYGSKNFLVAEAGILSKPNKQLSIAAHVYNPTRVKLADYNNEHIPTIFKLGMLYNFSDKVILALETEKDISKQAVFKSGIEYMVLKSLFFRVGVSTNPVLCAFGFGAVVKSFKIDISANYNQTLGFCQQLGLSYSFQKNKNHRSDGNE